MTDNELIEQWLGNECKCEIAQGEDFESGRYWGACPMHNEYYGNARPFVTVDSFAPILLNELRTKGYESSLECNTDSFMSAIYKDQDCIEVERRDTISAAVSSAVLRLIEEDKE